MSAPPSRKELLRAIKAITKTGQPVFPCKADAGDRTKAPWTKNGFKDASTDPEQIKRWWTAKPDAAIGIPTGIKHDVLDVDIKENADGRAHLPYLQRLGLLNGCEMLVRTPSGGYHLYFPATPGMTNKARGASLGLDVRGAGGYVIAPPSWIRTPDYSGAYEYITGIRGNTDEPLRWDLIVATLSPTNTFTNEPVDLLPSERRASIAALREWVSIREKGERNNALHWAVCRCIDNNIDPRELIEPALLTGLTEAEIMLTINSALKRAGVRADDLDTEAEAMFGKN